MSICHNQHGDHQCNCSKSTVASQSLDELEFERGIWTAAIDGNLNKLKSLIDRGHLHDRDNSAYTALHYAARSGHLEICKTLLENGIDVNATTNGGATALHRAAMMGHHHIVDLLLVHQADSTTQDTDGKTALHRAAEKNHFEVCQTLIQYNPSLVKARDHRGNTPLDLADKSSKKHQQLLDLMRCAFMYRKSSPAS